MAKPTDWDGMTGAHFYVTDACRDKLLSAAEKEGGLLSGTERRVIRDWIDRHEGEALERPRVDMCVGLPWALKSKVVKAAGRRRMSMAALLTQVFREWYEEGECDG